MEIKLKEDKHKGYIICRRLNKVFYIFKEARQSLQYGWLCKCGQFTKLDPYYHDAVHHTNYDEDIYLEDEEPTFSMEEVKKSPIVTFHMRYWIDEYPNEKEHDYTFKTHKIAILVKVAELCKKFNANKWIIYNDKHKQILSGESI